MRHLWTIRSGFPLEKVRIMFFSGTFPRSLTDMHRKRQLRDSSLFSLIMQRLTHCFFNASIGDVWRNL